MTLNLLLLIGNTGRDAELRYTSNGRAVCNFSMAVNRRWQVNEEWQEETEWFNVAVWGQQAENVANKVRRGDRVFVEGRLSSREYEASSGAVRHSLEVNAFRVINLTKKEGEGEGGEEAQAASASQQQQPSQPDRQDPREASREAPPPADNGGDKENLDW